MHLAFGATHDVLLDSLDGAHLLVVGSRGRGTLASLVLGSVSAGVAATAPCPVAVIRDAEARRDSPTFSGRVAVGVDGSEVSHGRTGPGLRPRVRARDRRRGRALVGTGRRTARPHQHRAAPGHGRGARAPGRRVAGRARREVPRRRRHHPPGRGGPAPGARRRVAVRRPCSSSAPVVAAPPGRRCSARSAGTSSSTRTARSSWSALPPDRKNRTRRARTALRHARTRTSARNNGRLGAQQRTVRAARTHGSADKNQHLGGGGEGRTRVPAC